MTDKPTPKEIEDLFVEETGFATDDFPAAIFDFARAALAKWGTPAPTGVGEVAERYRNAIASACEGWTMPDGLRKHLETALWSQPTTAQADSVLEDAARYRWLRRWKGQEHEPPFTVQHEIDGTLWGGDLDAAIDAAMNKGGA